MKIANYFVAGLLLWCASSTAFLDSAQAEERQNRFLQKFRESNASGGNYQDWQDANRSRTLPVKIYIPTTGSAPYPIVIFSHGLGGSRDAATYLGDYWSQHGYLCLFIQHPGSDSSVWQSAGARNRNQAMGALKSAANVQNSIDRIEDVKFTIDEITRRNQSDPLLKGKADLNRIAVSGHSFGAGTSLYIAGQTAVRSGRDERVKAAIYLCPPVPGRVAPEIAYGSITIPGMTVTGTKDDSPINETKASARRIPFDSTKAPHQYLVTFDGADHGIFAGGAARVAMPQNQLFYEQMEKITTEFLDAYLKGDAQAKHWMDSEAASYLGKSAKFESK